MAERNSSSSGTTRDNERGSAGSASRGIPGTQSTRQSSVSSASGSTTGEPTSSGTSTEGSTGSLQQTHHSGIADKVREQANERLSSQKDRALDGIGAVSQAVRQTTQSLRDQRHDTIARYVEQAADQIERFTQNLRNRDVGELIVEGQRLARRQPALFVGSAFALGLLGARFFKSSAPDYDEAEYGRQGSRYTTGTVGGGYAQYEGTQPGSGIRPERY